MPTTRKPRAQKSKAATNPQIELQQMVDEWPSVRQLWRSRTAKATKRALKPLPSSWQLAKASLRVLRAHRVVFAGVTILYIVFMLLLVRGLSTYLANGDLQALVDGKNSLATGFGAFAVLVATSNSTTDQASAVYQTVLGFIFSLAYLWILRQVFAGGRRLRVRDAFYQGMYPLIPVMLVVVVIALQLIPMLIGASLFTLVVGNGIAANTFETVLWAIVFAGFIAITLYLVCASVFSLYIAALPDMTPLKALRSGRELVRGRRLSLLRKILFLAIALLLVAAIIMVPIILYATPAAPIILFVLSMVAVPIVHTYMYTLYRELLV